MHNYALYLLIIPLILWFLIKIKHTNIEDMFAKNVLDKILVNKHSLLTHTRLKIVILSMVFVLIALARPIIPQGEITIKTETSEIIIAIDISKSMLASDIYPNRLEFAKNKIKNSLKKIQNSKIAIIGFANNAFLISPLTNDFITLEEMIDNFHPSDNLVGTNFMSILKTTNDLTENVKHKQVLLLTDGGDTRDFTQAIAYANTHNIKIFIYDISTTKGATIQTGNGLLKDKSGNIVLVKSNPNITQLAEKTGGKYQKYSLQTNDLSSFVKNFMNKKQNGKTTITSNIELFYYPLILAIALIMVAFFSLPKVGKND